MALGTGNDTTTQGAPNMSIAFRKILVCLIAVIAFSAIASASASAFNLEWEVCEKGTGTGTKFSEHKCNTHLGGTEEWEFKKLVGTQKVTSKGGAFTLEVTGKKIKCTSVTDKGTITGGKPGTDLAEEIVFTGCTTSQAGCKVRSTPPPIVAFGTIVVTNIKTKLEEVAGKLVDKFEQKEVENAKKEKVKEFVTLEFEAEAGKSCSEFPTTKVKGDVAAECKNLANGNVELVFPKPAIAQTPKLEAFGLAATLTGTVEEELENKWAFRCT
jgi:hypothetical protein